jgi:beta-lactamase superfamily II metal-dependent hydrolase
MAFTLIFMDAGQGDSTLIVYPDNSITLVDCGCKKNKNIVSVEIGTVLARFLASAGNKLKALVLTHPDGDHYNLVDPLIVQKGVTVGTVYYGGLASDYSGLTTWLNNHPNAVKFNQGHGSVDVVPGLSHDGTTTKTPNVEVRILAANAADPKVKSDANPNSIVLLVTYLDLNFFLMGDSTNLTEIFIEMRLGTHIATLMTNRRSVLKVGHHGSNTSSTEAWLKRVQPQVAFISSDTKTFHGVSIPRSGVTKRILDVNKLHDFGNTFEHKYVQYNDATDRHEQVSTTLALYTTLHLLAFTPPTQDIEFTAYGTSWYYQVDDKGIDGLRPACDWPNINKAY